MTTLVTGADGLVGSALREIAGNDFHFVTRHDADLTDFSATFSLFSSIKPEKVIHLAAKVGGIGGNLMESADYFRENIQINLNTLESARLTGVRKLVSFMSTCVFPSVGPFPLKSSYLHAGPPHQSNFGYAYAKRMLEVHTRALRYQWKLDYNIAIPCNIYGEHDNFDLIEGHVIPSLIHKAYLAKVKGHPLDVWGDGSPLREFIYAKDVARVTLWMLDHFHDEEPLIISPGSEISIKTLVEKIAATIKFDGEISFDSSKPAGQLRKPSDNSTLLKLLPNFDFTPIEVGISNTVDWFQQNYPKVRGAQINHA